MLATLAGAAQFAAVSIDSSRVTTAPRSRARTSSLRSAARREGPESVHALVYAGRNAAGGRQSAVRRSQPHARVDVRAELPADSGAADKEPFLIPLAIGLLGRTGAAPGQNRTGRGCRHHDAAAGAQRAAHTFRFFDVRRHRSVAAARFLGTGDRRVSYPMPSSPCWRGRMPILATGGTRCNGCCSGTCLAADAHEFGKPVSLDSAVVSLVRDTLLDPALAGLRELALRCRRMPAGGDPLDRRSGSGARCRCKCNG